MNKTEINVDKLVEVGAHFGHPASNWNPNYEKFISSKKNGIHIIDLIQTEKQIKRATKELVDKVFDIVNKSDSVIRLLAFAKSAIRHNMSKDLPNMNMPICLVWGKQDKVTPPHVAEEFQSLFPNSELFWIDKCGHSPMWEHPEKFSEITIDWLNNHF